MDRKSNFFICEKCKNLIEVIQFSSAPLSCCGERMYNIVPVTEDKERGEKHLPIVNVVGDEVRVNVGTIMHPATDEHYIAWVYLKTKFGEQRKYLIPGEEPSVAFALKKGDIPLTAYAYCNLHGLFKTHILKESEK